MNLKEVLKIEKLVSLVNQPKLVKKIVQSISPGIKKISLRTEKGYTFCDYKEIIYLKAEERHTWIYLRDGAIFKVRYHGISKFQKCLEKQRGFLRIHRQYIINTDYLQEYDKEHERVKMNVPENKKSWLPVGTSYYDEFEQTIKGLQPYEHKDSEMLFEKESPSMKQLLSLLVYLMIVIYNGLSTVNTKEETVEIEAKKI